MTTGEFIAVDWGTSSFRAALIDGGGKVLGRVSSGAGISGLDATGQVEYLLAETASLASSNVVHPYMLCGMVGSSIGMQEVAYLDCPSGPAQFAKKLERINCADIEGWIVPGLRCQSTVGDAEFMRGEETQCLGWLSQSASQSPAVLCLPGTHSKWVQCDDGRIESLNTVLTGELYGLLRNDSILVKGEQCFDEVAFIKGVERVSKGEPLLQALFSCRSRVLSGEMQAESGAAYLSGLLIGSEVVGQQALIRNSNEQNVMLVGDASLCEHYQRALQFHGVASVCHSGGDMVIAGLTYLYRQKKGLV